MILDVIDTIVSVFAGCVPTNWTGVSASFVLCCNVLRPVHTGQQGCRKRQQFVAGVTATLLPKTATNCSQKRQQGCRFRQQFVAVSGNNLVPFPVTICCHFRQLCCLVCTGLYVTKCTQCRSGKAWVFGAPGRTTIFRPQKSSDA